MTRRRYVGGVGYSWLVTLVLGLHFAYLAYLVVGGFFAWRWPKMIVVHVLVCIWGVLVVFGKVNCPLTAAENWARVKAGQTPPTAGFIDRYLDNVIYPDRYVNFVRLAVVLVVAVSWIGAYGRWRVRSRQDPHRSPTRVFGLRRGDTTG